MRIVRTLALKVVLPLGVAGVTLLSGVAVAVPSIGASVANAPAVASAPGMHYETQPLMHYE